MKRKYEGQIIGVTGFNLHDNKALEKIIELEGGIVKGDIGYDEVWEEEQIIVIGRTDFGEEYLKESIRAGNELEFRCRYMTQEDFWDLWLDDEEFIPYYKSDPRINKHEGLKFLASIGFKFPTIKEVFGEESENPSDFSKRRLESELKSEFGYNVLKKTPLSARRNSLRKAISEQNGLGLKSVVFHIFGRIGENRRRKNMGEAVKKWKTDLGWLKEHFYEDTIHSFRFPEY